MVPRLRTERYAMPKATIAEHLAPGELAARILDACVRDAGADPPRRAQILDPRQREASTSIRSVAREPQIEHRTERLAACEELRLAAVLSQ